MTDAIARARAVIEAATPAPWRHWYDEECPDDVRVCHPAGDAERCAWCIALAGETSDCDEETGVGHTWTPETIARWRADARAIALARNVLPALLDVLEAARTVVHECSAEDGGCPFCNEVGIALAALERHLPEEQARASEVGR